MTETRESSHATASHGAHPLDTHTAVEVVGSDRMTATLDPSWWSYNGPHGGYLAAILLRSLLTAAGDHERPVRSLCVCFMAPLKVGTLELETRVERRGASLTVASVHAAQGDHPGALGVATMAASRPSSVSSLDATMPSVPGPQDCPSAKEASPAVFEIMSATVPFTRHLEIRPATRLLPFSGGERGELTAWVRLPGRSAADAIGLTVLCDAIFAGITAKLSKPIAIPTLEMTIHYAPGFERLGHGPNAEWALVVNRNRLVSDGYAFEDGEVWSSTGVLMARSRQLLRLLEV